MTLPSSWPAVLSGKSSKAVASNHVFLSLYTVAVPIPVMLGFYAVVHLDLGPGEENAAILAMARESRPPWLLAVVVIAGASCAMVPAAGGLISVATLVSSNLVPSGMSSGAQLLTGRTTAGVVSVLVLAMTLERPDLMANLYLLTYSGMIQLAPGNMIALRDRVPVGSAAVIAGVVAGECVVVGFTVLEIDFYGISAGLIGRAVNLLVLGLVHVGSRSARARNGREVAGAAPSALSHV